MNFKTVLIADDAPFIRDILSHLIEKSHPEIKIIEADSGAEAVVAFESHKPDLVFMDIVMPKISGIEATKKIREIDKYVPIIALSTLDSGITVEKILEAGANLFLKKPFEANEIKNILDGDF